MAHLERAFLPHFPLAGRAERERYRIEAVVERGAFGIVYRVQDSNSKVDGGEEVDAVKAATVNPPVTNDEFALKVLSKSQVRLGCVFVNLFPLRLTYLSNCDVQIIRNGALEQLKNEVDIQTVCGHHPFIVQCIAYWQTHRTICIREYCGTNTNKCVEIFTVHFHVQ